MVNEFVEQAEILNAYAETPGLTAEQSARLLKINFLSGAYGVNPDVRALARNYVNASLHQNAQARGVGPALFDVPAVAPKPAAPKPAPAPTPKLPTMAEVQARAAALDAEIAQFIAESDAKNAKAAQAAKRRADEQRDLDAAFGLLPVSGVVKYDATSNIQTFGGG